MLFRLALVLSCFGYFSVLQASRIHAQESNIQSVKLVDYEVQLDTIMKHDDGKFLWFHPRIAPYLRSGSQQPAVMMTLQKHLMTASDFYSGLSVMSTIDNGTNWSSPDERPELAWRDESEQVIVGVCDVTPGWHPQSKKLIAIGTQLRYSKDGEQLLEQPRSYDTAYAVYDPMQNTWSRWKNIDFPELEEFYLLAPGCVQWIVEPDGKILLPFYFRGSDGIEFETCAMKCKFDGNTLSYVEHGNVMQLHVERGLCEPSIVKFQEKYLLTIRNDQDTYVASSDDGLHYSPMKQWQFDDGSPLGTYNTQQHWLGHSEGLFLIYNRKGANNDRIFRHRAPLFMAQVNPSTLQVVRESERVLVPNRGATLGNFGAAPVSENESWVSVSEGIFQAGAREQGADGSTFIARIKWAKPNRRFSLSGAK